MKRWIQFDDQGPDDQGRRHFTLFWLREGELPGTESTATFRGTRRAQCFFSAQFSNELALGAVVVTCAPWGWP